MKSNQRVEDIIVKMNFSKELELLREIILTTDVEETIKWGMPVYTYLGANILGIGAFKSHFGVWFFQGALLEDPYNKLMNAQEGKTKALRQWRMRSAGDINARMLKSYIREALVLESSGIRIAADKPPKRAPTLPPELRQTLDATPKLKAAFGKLSPAKQREYGQYVTEAKRAATKVSRIEKITPLILAGAGLHDKYKP